MTHQTEFVSHLLSLSPENIADLQKNKPKGSNVRHKIALLEGSQGGERQARETLMTIYGAHGLHTSKLPLLEAMAYATAQGTLKAETTERFLFAHRSDLARLLRPAARQLQRAEVPFDYYQLYQDLLYHRPETSKQWQETFQTSLFKYQKEKS